MTFEMGGLQALAQSCADGSGNWSLGGGQGCHEAPQWKHAHALTQGAGSRSPAAVSAMKQFVFAGSQHYGSGLAEAVLFCITLARTQQQENVASGAKLHRTKLLMLLLLARAHTRALVYRLQYTFSPQLYFVLFSIHLVSVCAHPQPTVAAGF